MIAGSQAFDRSAGRSRDGWRKLRKALRNPVTTVGVAIVTAFVLCAAFAPLIAPHPAHGYGSPSGGERLQPPSWAHPFGTDTLGRDLFSRVIIGSRLSLQIIGLSLAAAVLIGVTVGLVAGYSPRWVEELLMRLTDMFLSLPSLIVAMLIAITLGAGIPATVVAIALTYWPRYARIVRGETLRLRTMPFVEAAVVLGASDGRVVRRHILPNTIPTVLVQASLDSGATLLTAAALGFLGLGAQSPAPEWGLLVAIGRELMPDFWWLSAFPGLAIFIVVLGLSLTGDGLRTVLDPKSRIDQG